MKSLIQKTLLCLTLITVSFWSISQDDSNTDVKDRDFRIEIEPSSFILKGVAGSVSYNLTQDNNLNMGLYAATTDVPYFLGQNMFDGIGDTTSNRLAFQIALMTRYRLRLFKDWESNPYVGLITGWEYFNLQQPSDPNPIRISTFLLTPYVGYEFYFFKQMLYINPQVRGVFYLGAKSDTPSRPEGLKWGLILPQISLGVRI